MLAYFFSSVGRAVTGNVTIAVFAISLPSDCEHLEQERLPVLSRLGLLLFIGLDGIGIAALITTTTQ